MAHEFGAGPGPAGADPGFGAVADIWKRVTGEDISGGTPLWVNSFGDANRLLTRYRHGRVLFAGDAAHQQMPIGGQALNLGLQDAFNLGWKLASQVSGGAPDGMLDSYHDERHEVGRRVLANISAQATLLLGGPEVDPVRAVLGELIGIEAARRHLAGMISGLDVRYPADGADHPLAGARLPHFPLAGEAGEQTSTTALLRSGHGLLVDFTAAPGRLAALRSLVGSRSSRVRVAAGRPDAAPNLGALLARPDGYVAWAATAAADLSGPAGPEDALRRWFGRR
jgi:hypothetical protein